jgi:hypothetical protein
MKTLTQINDELRAAEARVRELRDERARVMVEACPNKVGSEFTLASGRHVKVIGVAAAAKSNEVWLTYRWKTQAGTWSQGRHVTAVKLADDLTVQL